MVIQTNVKGTLSSQPCNKKYSGISKVMICSYKTLKYKRHSSIEENVALERAKNSNFKRCCRSVQYGSQLDSGEFGGNSQLL
jgi:hypothetical protein